MVYEEEWQGRSFIFIWRKKHERHTVRDDQDMDECFQNWQHQQAQQPLYAGVLKCIFVPCAFGSDWLGTKPSSDLLPSGFRCLSREGRPSTLQESIIYLARPQKDTGNCSWKRFHSTTHNRYKLTLPQIFFTKNKETGSSKVSSYPQSQGSNSQRNRTWTARTLVGR